MSGKNRVRALIVALGLLLVSISSVPAATVLAAKPAHVGATHSRSG